MGHWLKVGLVIALLIGGGGVVFAQTSGGAPEAPTNVLPDAASTTPAATAAIATTIPGKKANEPGILSVVDPPRGRPY